MCAAIGAWRTKVMLTKSVRPEETVTSAVCAGGDKIVPMVCTLNEDTVQHDPKNPQTGETIQIAAANTINFCRFQAQSSGKPQPDL